MRLRTLTKAVVLAVPLCVGLYDLAAFLAAGSDATVSRVVLAWLGPVSVQAGVALVAAGWLLGHVFTAQHPDPAADKVPGWRGRAADQLAGKRGGG